jgi:protein-disulfide isomerase
MENTPQEPALESRPPQSSAIRKDRSALYTPVAIVVAGFFIAGGLYLGLASGSGAGAQVAAGAQPQQPVDIKNVKLAGEPYIGNPNAPVTLAFWSDYQCPFCKAFETGGVPQITTPAAMPDLIKKYVDTGKVKIVFKDFAFLGEDSTTAAEYGRAIWDLYPDQYFAWRTAMYKAQDEEGDKGFGRASTIDQLIQSHFAKMDVTKIKQQISSKKAAYDKAIADDRAEGEQNGIGGTPGFVTGKQLISGAQPIATFASAIDPQLK